MLEVLDQLGRFGVVELIELVNVVGDFGGVLALVGARFGRAALVLRHQVG